MQNLIFRKCYFQTWKNNTNHHTNTNTNQALTINISGVFRTQSTLTALRILFQHRSKILYEAGLRIVKMYLNWANPDSQDSLQIAPYGPMSCSECRTPNNRFSCLNSLTRVDLPSFVYRYYSKQGILSRTYCYTQ